jgi:hypothetical protein
MIGVRADWTKGLVALSDGFRGSSESQADLLRDCKRRGMTALVLPGRRLAVWLRRSPGLATAATRARIFSLPNR